MKNGTRLFYLLIISIVADGLVRRLFGGQISNYLIFVKDAIVLSLSIKTFASGDAIAGYGKITLRMCAVAAVVILPCFVRTAILDPVLAVFGGKQYVLFVWVAPATFLIFSRQPIEAIYRLFRFLGAVVVLTSALAFIQLKLPADNILNQTVAGDTMSEFSAGGFLRVSSSFPFVAQYTMFLNFAIAAVFFGIAKPSKKNGWLHMLSRPWILVPSYLVGIFATASRSAVWGAGAMIAVVAGFLVTRGKNQMGRRLILGIFAAYCGLGIIGLVAPEVIAGYIARTSGESGIDHRVEMTERIYESLTRWTTTVEQTAFGHGLGLMSNGSDKISKIAASVRSDGTWTETDLATTYYEGGMYLILAWSLFRTWVLVLIVRKTLRIRNPEIYLVCSGLSGFIVVTGIIGTLGIQPPLAIWFWMAVGLVFALGYHDRFDHTSDVSSVNARLTLRRPQFLRIPHPRKMLRRS